MTRAERRRPRVEAARTAGRRRRHRRAASEPAREARAVGRFARPEAAVAAAAEGRAEGAAAGPGHRAEAGRRHRRPRRTRRRAACIRRRRPRPAGAGGGRRAAPSGTRAAGRARSGSRAARRRRRRGRRPAWRSPATRRTPVADTRAPGPRRGPPSCAGPGCRRPSRTPRSSRASWSPHAIAMISSACSGVLTEPSTNRMSNGPDERFDVASANSTMSTRSAIASSSSSRSSSVSWQPSHEANLTTPIRGRWRMFSRDTAVVSITGPPRVNVSPSSATEKTGPSRQTKYGPSWQWPHRPTPHAMCRSSVTPGARRVDARDRRASGRWPASSAPVRRRTPWCARQSMARVRTAG